MTNTAPPGAADPATVPGAAGDTVPGAAGDTGSGPGADHGGTGSAVVDPGVVDPAAVDPAAVDPAVVDSGGAESDGAHPATRGDRVGTGIGGRAPGTWTMPIRPALGCAVLAGVALLASFPPIDAWYLAPFGVGLLAVIVHRRGFWSGFRLGGVTGLALFVPLLRWTTIVGGAPPWLLLAAMEAAFIGLYGGAAALLSPVVERRRWTWPLVTGVLWVAQEAVRDREPFGGFPWGRLAFSQGNSPLLRYAVAGGAPLVTFAVALCGGLLAVAGWCGWAGLVRRRDTSWPELRRVLGPVALAVIAAVGALAVPTSAPTGRAVEVAIVQGNVPRLGLEFNAQRRAVLDNHVRATLELATRVHDGRAPKPDIVIWPENSSDIDPLIADDPGDSDAAGLISQAADEIDAPILIGAVLEGPGSNDRNASIVWLPSGYGGGVGGPQSGPHGMYVKQHPVPFAEYIPLRGVARMVSKRVDLVTHDFIAGHTSGVLTMGPVTVGDAICFEVAYDNIVRDSVTGGAQLLAVQTNNADFNSAEAAQQLAMVRLRAVEHGRDALMVSTVGISGFVDASGGVHNETGFDVAATELRTLRLGDHRTLATELGPVPEFVAAAIAVALLIGAAGRKIADRRRAGQESPGQRGSGQRGFGWRRPSTTVIHASNGTDAPNGGN